MTQQTYTMPLGVEQIREILPHRWPFLLIDRVLELSDTRIVAQKCVSVNEWFFLGHFPQQSVMPGVLQVEAIAQCGAVMTVSRADYLGRMTYLVGVDGAKFRRMVIPGDVLRIEVNQIMHRRNIAKAEGQITVEGQLVCEATITCAIGEAKG